MSEFVLSPTYLANLQATGENARQDVLEQIANDARRMAPVDTGFMRSTIRVEGDRVVVDADYWEYVEYGTSRMSAQPFMRPALYRQRGGG